eukprot:TRINITY_DN13848_c0_g1_i1.p1 TRINITY_DN13848_c0_g1~~TRINITY_DN13848_c0_g1_i1.p1  ORF type:complete len:334 (+),score=123.73 TRINITY_DN13848_c0_g1_i1:119-1120(+)
MSLIRENLKAVLKENEQLAQENEVLGRYAKRHEDEIEELVFAEESKKRNRKKGRAPQTLTVDQKLDLTSSELEHQQRSMEECKKNSEKLIDTLKAVIEATDVRIAELKKDAYEFKRDIVVGAEHARTGKTVAEKVVHYMEDKLRQKDQFIDKLRLKNSTLRSHAAKAEHQLRHKEEMGDALHYIDFHQLQIENKQYLAKIEEKNQELLSLKMTTGNTVQVLNELKKKLSDLLTESEWLNKEIRQRTELLSKIDAELGRVESDIAKETVKVTKLKELQEGTEDMPTVMDYVKQKAEMNELRSAVKQWERKLEILEVWAQRILKSKPSRSAVEEQ